MSVEEPGIEAHGHKDRMLYAMLLSKDTSLAFLGSKKIMIDILQHICRTQDIDEESAIAALEDIFETLPRNLSRDARKQIEITINHLVSRLPSIVLPFLVRRLTTIAGRLDRFRSAVSVSFDCLNWVNSMIPNLPEKELQYWILELLPLQSSFLSYALRDGKPSVADSAIKSTRRCYRSLFCKKMDSLKKLVSFLLTETENAILPPKSLPLYGVIISTCYYFHQSPTPRNEISQQAELFSKIMAQNVLMAKPALEKYLYHEFCYSLGLLLSIDQLKLYLLPSIEKALLRSPEIIFSGILSSLAHGFADSKVDASSLILSSVLTSFVNGLKSSNAEVRRNCFQTFKDLSANASDNESLSRVASELITSLRTGKVTASDQRVLFVDALSSLSLKHIDASMLLNELLPLFTKAKESDFNSLASLIVKTLKFLLMNGRNPGDKIYDFLSKSLQRPVAHESIFWLTSLATMAWDLPASDDVQIEFINFFLNNLSVLTEKALMSVSGATQNGTYLAPIIYLSFGVNKLSVWNSERISHTLELQDILVKLSTPKNNDVFIFSSKITNKLNDDQSKLWYFQGLCDFAKVSDNLLFSNFVERWFQSVIGVFSFASRENSNRALKILKSAILYRPHLRMSICSQLWNYHADFEKSKSVGKFDSAKYDEISSLFQSLILSSMSADTSNFSNQELVDFDKYLVELLFLSFAFKDKFDWIRFCQVSKRDPATLVSERIHSIIEEIELLLSSAIKDSKETAAIASISMIVFVAPEESIPLFVNVFRNQLLHLNISSVSSTDLEIWKTPEGVLWDNVLEKKSSKKLDKNTKDYETKRWEAEVRAKQSAKKPAKLSKDQQALVDAQLDAEAKIRSRVNLIALSLERGLGIIRSLGEAVQLAPALWVEDAIDVLLFHNVLKYSEPFLKNLAYDTFLLTLKASGFSERLGDRSYSSSLASILAHTFSVNSSENIKELTKSILYKLRFAIEQNYFEPQMFACIFPLLYDLTFNITNSDEEDEAELQLLVTEILEFQAPYSASLRRMRSKLIKSLLHLLEIAPTQYQENKNSLLSLCEGLHSTYTDEELNLLLSNLFHPESSIRSAVLQALQAFDLSRFEFIKEIFLELYDDNETNASIAHQISTQNGLDATETSFFELQIFFTQDSDYLQQIIGKSLIDLLDEFEELGQVIPKELMRTYRENALPSAPEYDEYGIIKKETIGRDLGRIARESVAVSFFHISKYLSSNLLLPFLEFLLTASEAEAQIPVTDASQKVSSKMLEAGKLAIFQSGAHQVEALMELFEQKLNVDSLPTDANDRLREATVVLFGTVAQHLPSNDPRLAVVMDSLLSVLSTPSESVQLAVAVCLPPLVKKSLGKSKEYYELLSNKLMNSTSLADQKGAAYGLAGLVKGYGIKAFQDFNILDSLSELISNRQNATHRQAALFAVEAFSRILGIYFEPYLPDLLPLLLTSFGDNANEVREATMDAVKQIMSQLSAFGVKLLLPTLLDGLNEYNWRSKKASVEILGLMSYMAPKQLSVFLPTIIPKLSEVLTDSHSQVRNTANKSLLRFGDVISNPEIQTLVPTLLKALSDCTRYTDDALEALLKTSFVHYLDPPSLALVIPILKYGLRERNAATKRQSAKIFGLMASLTEPENLAVYLESLMPRLREVLIDPVPDTRATAAKALGSLIEKLGEKKFPTLIPELFNVLRSECSEVDRQGAAQGLSEILAGLGLARLEDVLPEILKNTSSPVPHIRESFISLLIYLPATFGSRFQPYLARAIPPILSGLADDSELVQTASLRAAKMIVNNYATKSVDLLLPELEKGLFDNAWRIRLSSVQLVGDLVFKLAGINRKALQEDEEEEGTHSDVSRKALLDIIGQERHDRILSTLYIVRQDIAAVVRTPAIQIWKAIVVNTPRTVREILPTLTSIIVSNLNSSSNDRRTMCVKSLGDLLKKAGFDVLPQLLPVLKQGLESANSGDRIGVCIALEELINSATPEQLEIYSDDFVYAVRRALMDGDLEVRETAAEAFDSLQSILGDRAVDDVLPQLLKLLESENQSEQALSALREIISRRSSTIFPVLIPTLIKQPVSAFNARALSSLAQVAGVSLNKRLPSILNALMESSLASTGDDLVALNGAIDKVNLSVKDQEGLQILMAHFYSFSESEDFRKRLFAAEHMLVFFQNCKLDYYRYVGDWVRHFITLFEDKSQDVVVAAVAAQNTLVSALRKDQLDSLVSIAYHSLRDVGSQGVNLPAFEVAQGVNSILPIFLYGLMHGTMDQREQSALGIADIVLKTEPSKLRPFVTQITGPLIRIIGERFPVEVKCAILYTLNIILSKISTFLRPFLPQLQRTFAKCLGDPSSEVIRSRAATALGTLITLQTRLAPIITELVSGARTPDAGVRKAMLNALFAVVSKSGQNMNEASAEAIEQLLDEISAESSEHMVICAKLYGALFSHLPDAQAKQLLESKVLSLEIQSEFSVLILNAAVKFGSQKIIELKLSDIVCSIISTASLQKEVTIAENGILALGKALLADIPQSFGNAKNLVEALKVNIEAPPSTSQDSRRLALVIIRVVSKENYSLIKPHISILAPAIFGCVRAIVIPVKLAAEAAFLALFQLVEDDSVLNKYIETLEGPRARSFVDYSRRVAVKLAAAERDRINSGSERVKLEEVEDLAEINAVGRDNEVSTNDP
ncbi:eIF-2-alpha kinase activator gcn1 [Schizosaccharomyces pombe]